MRGSPTVFMKAATIGLSLGLISCQATALPEPAVLERVDDETLAQLKTVIATAMGRSQFDYGVMDLTQSPVIPILPPRPTPVEGQSVAMPTYFDLATDEGECLVIRRSSGEAFLLEGVRCNPVSN